MVYNKDENGDVTLSFIERTKKNWDKINKMKEENLEDEHFEVTQIINSMLGMIVFPKEKILKIYRNYCLKDLVEGGWPKDIIIEDKYGVLCLWEFIRHIRNSISHSNYEIQGVDNQISSITFIDKYNNKENFRVTFTVLTLEIFLNKFYQYITDDNNKIDYERMGVEELAGL